MDGNNWETRQTNVGWCDIDRTRNYEIRSRKWARTCAYNIVREWRISYVSPEDSAGQSFLREKDRGKMDGPGVVEGRKFLAGAGSANYSRVQRRNGWSPIAYLRSKRSAAIDSRRNRDSSVNAHGRAFPSPTFAKWSRCSVTRGRRKRKYPAGGAWADGSSATRTYEREGTGEMKRGGNGPSLFWRDSWRPPAPQLHLIFGRASVRLAAASRAAGAIEVRPLARCRDGAAWNTGAFGGLAILGTRGRDRETLARPSSSLLLFRCAPTGDRVLFSFSCSWIFLHLPQWRFTRIFSPVSKRGAVPATARAQYFSPFPPPWLNYGGEMPEWRRAFRARRCSDVSWDNPGRRLSARNRAGAARRIILPWPDRCVKSPSSS